ncbi:MAG: hypothetical protein CSA75_01960 [Sorangium cellulosum]|nr:MAG: hypothetical protein CSA75_01960 [Sorangium cellulosum]
MQVRSFLRFGWVGMLAVAGVLGVAYAQDGASAPVDTGSAEMQRQVQLTPDQMSAEAGKILAGMEAASKNVRAELAKAREQRDVVKALCLDDKLTQMDVARRSAGERAEALDQAVARQDKELATHEYTILVVLKDRVSQLSSEANRCIGAEIGFVGEAKVTLDIDPNLPADEPSEYPENPVITVPPGCVSCVQ